MKRFSNLLEKQWFAYSFALCVAVLFYMLLSHIEPIVSVLGGLWIVVKPLFIGFVIAYLLNPIMVFFEKLLSKKIKEYKTYHNLAFLITIVLAVAVIAILIRIVMPSLISSITKVASNIPVYQRNVNWALGKLEEIAVNTDFTALQKIVNNFTKTVVDNIQNNIPQNLSAIVSTSVSIGTYLYNTILGIIFALYFLSGKKQIFASISVLRHAALTEKEYKRQTDFLERCHKIIIKYIGCDLLDSLIVGIVNAIVMMIIGIPFIPLISLIVGVTNLAPTFGPIVGGIMGALVLLFNEPKDALIFIIITIVIQIADGYVIKPKLFGGSLGVPAVWILAAIIMGGQMFGVAGILLAIPFAAIFTFVYREACIPYLKKYRDRRNEKGDSK